MSEPTTPTSSSQAPTAPPTSQAPHTFCFPTAGRIVLVSSEEGVEWLGRHDWQAPPLMTLATIKLLWPQARNIVIPQFASAAAILARLEAAIVARVRQERQHVSV